MAPMTGVGAVFAIYFVSYDMTERFIRKSKGYGAAQNLAMTDVLACGAMTGVVGTVILAPAELLKVQQQTATNRGLDSGFKAVCSRIYQAQGLRGFLTGFGSTLARDVPGSMAWFGAYEYAKMSLCADPKAPTSGEALMAGGCGGLGMWLTAMPLDTIKTRVQASPGGKLSFTGVRRVRLCRVCWPLGL
jgi:solute carrier family 25 carnitine/acylcarnitine transporter 20/29